MKAEVKKTGKIVEVFEAPRGNIYGGEMQYLDGDGNFYSWEDLDFTLPETFDQLAKSLLDSDSSICKVTNKDIAPYDIWEERRFDISKQILAVLIYSNRAHLDPTSESYPTRENVAWTAVAYADALIKELKKTKQ